MGRSVDYLNHAEYVIYFTADWINAEEDNYLNELNWDDFISNLSCEIRNKLKSYSKENKWDGRETKIFLENNLCEIGISEYCGLYSLSIRVKEYDWQGCQLPTIGLAKNHAEQIRNTLEKCLVDSGAELLNRIGTFSNGCGVFKKQEGYYENADRVV